MRSLLALAFLIGLPMSAEALEAVPDIVEQWRLEPSTLEKAEEKPRPTEIDMNVDSYLIDVARSGQLHPSTEHTV